MKNKFIRGIAAGVLSLTLVSNHFVAFAAEAIPLEEPVIETVLEEVEEESQINEELPIVTEDENLNPDEEKTEPNETTEETEELSTEEEQDTIIVDKDAEVEEKSGETEEEKIVSAPMPSISASVSENGMNVTVDADEGAFPEETTISISVIDDGTAESLATDALGENVTSAKAVDITFLDAEGIELQPAIDNAVHVNISLDNSLEGDNFTVLHDHDGSISPIGADVNSDGASFSSDEFSIFIVVGTGEDEGEDQKAIATYKFFVYNVEASDWMPFEGHEEQYIKSGDTLYNPGVPTIDPDKNEEFLGWVYENGDEVSFSTIESVTAGEVVNIYANIATTYYVTFVGIDNDVVQVKKIPGVRGEDAYTTVNNIPYSIQKSTQAFKGWTTTQNDESTLITDNNINARTTPIVYAYVIEAYWIHFDENDDLYDTDGTKISSGGASYVGPVAISQTKTPAEVIGTIPESSRPGYEFLGWYHGTKGADNNVILGDPFDWNELLTEDVTIYAKWDAHTDTELTINIWKQRLDKSGYDYVANASHIYEGVTGAKITCYSDYFHMDNPEGNYSYYSSSDVDMTGFSYNHADIVNSINDTLSAKGDTVINVYYNRNSYTLTFQARSGLRWTTVATITGIYEENIANKFPIKVGNVTYNNFWEVQGNPSTYVSGLLVGKIDKMPAENITFHRYTSQGRTFDATWNYYIETIDGAAGTESYDGKNFNLRNAIVLEVTSGMQSTEAEEFMDIRGFTKYKANPAFIDGVQDIIAGRPINLYYTRNKYTLTFMEGDTSLKTIKDIPYEKSLSSYEAQAPVMEDEEGQKFIGWYLDKSGTIPFNWNTTMPIDGQIVYAKYAPVRFRVTLNPNGGVIDTSKQAESFMEDYNGKLDSNSITKAVSKENWELVGWFYEDGPKAGQAYDWDKITETTTDYNYDSEKGYFVGTVNLIAGWRFPGLVHIKYDAGENGTDAPSADKYGYAYNSTVVVDRPSKPNTGYRFMGWAIKDDATNRIFYPNNSFVIDVSFVKNGVITLIAQYEEIGGSGTSTALVDITYHSNDSNNNTYTVEGLKVNQPTTSATLEEAFGTGYSRTGYKFLGWSKTSGDNNEVWLDAGTTYTIAADEEPTNDLYAVWEPAKKITYTDGVEDEQVFIDEVYEAYNGDTTPTFSSNKPERIGWTFTGWDPAVKEIVNGDATYTAKWKEDYSVTKEVKYTVNHVVDGEVKSTADFVDNIWINAEKDELAIQKGSLDEKEFTGYKLDNINPNVSEGDMVNDGTIITLTYIPDETVTQDVNYFVEHQIDGKVMDSAEFTDKIWINAEKMILIQKDSLAQKEYKGYKLNSITPNVKESDNISSGSTIVLTYVPDYNITKTVEYTVNHVIDDKIKDTKTFTEKIWINADDEITIQKDSITPNEYNGYKLDFINPNVKVGDSVNNKTVITLNYIPDESVTKDVSYTVNHIVNGELKDTETVTESVWINADNKITVTASSIVPKEYIGYKFIEISPNVSANDKVDDKTIITLTYDIDESVTKNVLYTVNHVIDNTIKDTEIIIQKVWINAEDQATIEANSIQPKEYYGYKFDNINPLVKAGDKIATNSVITLTYVPDETVTQEVSYTVNHVINGTIKDTKTYTQKIWVNAEPKATIEKESLTHKNYKGYKFNDISPDVVEGDSVKDGSIITLTYVKNDAETKELTYTVKHSVDGIIKDEITVTQTVWINDNTLKVEENSIQPNKYLGYKFDSINPNIKAGDEIADKTIITLKYIKDETVTTNINYIVNHLVNGVIKDTVIETQAVWINEKNKLLTVTEKSLALNEYENYIYNKTVYNETEKEVNINDKVPNNTIINIIYDPIQIRVRYEYRFAKEDEKPDVLPALPDPFYVHYGEDIQFIDLPKIEGFSLSDWAVEEDQISTLFSAKRSIPAPAHNIVVYTIITKDKVDPKPIPKPDPKDDDDDKKEEEKKDESTTIVEEQTPLASIPVIPPANPVKEVLGEIKEQITNEVLGARKGATEDSNSDTKRAIIAMGCLAIIMILLYVDKKEDKNDPS